MQFFSALRFSAFTCSPQADRGSWPLEVASSEAFNPGSSRRRCQRWHLQVCRCGSCGVLDVKDALSCHQAATLDLPAGFLREPRLKGCPSGSCARFYQTFSAHVHDLRLQPKQHRTSLGCLRFKFLNGRAWEHAEIVPMACAADPVRY